MNDLRQNFEQCLRDGVAKAASDYHIAAIRFGRSVEIDIGGPAGGFTVWIRPADVASACFASTASFKIGHHGEPSRRAGYAVLQQFADALTDWEATTAVSDLALLFAEGSCATTANESQTPPPWVPHLEWLAVRHGLKPAVRSAIAASQQSALIAESARLGLHSTVIEAREFIAGFTTGAQQRTAILYTATDPEAVARAAAAERTMIAADAAGRRPDDGLIRDLGAALGYPECCIAAFLPIRDAANEEIRFRALGSSRDECHATLNDLLPDRAIVSHLVCRYDCAASDAYAQGVLACLRSTDPKGADDIAARARGIVVLLRDGSAVRIPSQPGTAIEIAPGSGQTESSRSRIAALASVESIDASDPSVLVLHRRGADALRLPFDGESLLVRRFA